MMISKAPFSANQGKRGNSMRYSDSKRKRIVASVLLPLCFVAAQSA